MRRDLQKHKWSHFNGNELNLLFFVEKGKEGGHVVRVRNVTLAYFF